MHSLYLHCNCPAVHSQSSPVQHWLQTPPGWRCCWSDGKCHGTIFHNPCWWEKESPVLTVCLGELDVLLVLRCTPDTDSPPIKARGASLEERIYWSTKCWQHQDDLGNAARLLKVMENYLKILLSVLSMWVITGVFNVEVKVKQLWCCDTEILTPVPSPTHVRIT